MLHSNVVEPKTRWCTLMCVDQWQNDTIWCGTPYMPEFGPCNWNSYFNVDKRYRNMICIRLLEQVTKHQFIFLSKRYPYHGLQDAISKFLDLSGPSIQVGVSAREFLPMISGNLPEIVWFFAGLLKCLLYTAYKKTKVRLAIKSLHGRVLWNF